MGAVVLSVALTSTAPAGAASWVRVYDSASSRSALRVAALTAAEPNTYRITIARGEVIASAPRSNTDGNRRVVFWPADEPPADNGQVCATWQSETQAKAQQGLALAVRRTTSRTTAVTVTKNVIFGVHWFFNVHVWRVSGDGVTFRELASFDMSSVLFAKPGDHIAPLPWRVCARLVELRLTFKIWVPKREREPSWTNTRFVRTAAIPSTYGGRGRAGWYVGHIPRGGSIRYRDLGIWTMDSEDVSGNRRPLSARSRADSLPPASSCAAAPRRSRSAVLRTQEEACKQFFGGDRSGRWASPRWRPA